MVRRAFTLIELLVVISVIAVLVGILLPALSRSRQLGKASVCLSNLRSLSGAVHMYADANDGRFPSVGLAHGGAVDESTAWINVAIREIGNRKVAQCPSDESPHWLVPAPGGDLRRRLSYATNFYTVGTLEGREEYNVMTRIRRPSTTIFWAELAEQGQYAAADHVHPETWFSSPRRLASEQVQLDRHLGRANYGYVDGHADPQPFEETYSINRRATQFPNIAWIHNKYDPVVAW
jgi:prepilin-type N-terminal cleavage/methylation domain-containing protein/prepilin-type processing-associated H-X9-DG protein